MIFIHSKLSRAQSFTYGIYSCLIWINTHYILINEYAFDADAQFGLPKQMRFMLRWFNEDIRRLFSIENRTKQQFGNSFRERARKKKKEKYLNFCCSTCFIGSTLNHPAEERASAGNVQRTANLTSYKSIKPPEIHHIHILYAWQHKICLITEFQTRERAEEAIKAMREKPQEIISFHRAAPLHVDVLTCTAELQRWWWATNNVKCGFLDEIG